MDGPGELKKKAERYRRLASRTTDQQAWLQMMQGQTYPIRMAVIDDQRVISDL